MFKEDKMVGTINIVDSGILYALMGKRINFSYYYRENDKDIKSGIAFSFKLVRRKIEIDTSDSAPKINISLNYITSLDEYDSHHRLDVAENKEEMEMKLSDVMKSDCERILAYLQEVGSDPIGFAEMVRSKHNAYYKTIDWRRIYPEIEFNVEIKTTIESQGAVN